MVMYAGENAKAEDLERLVQENFPDYGIKTSTPKDKGTVLYLKTNGNIYIETDSNWEMWKIMTAPNFEPPTELRGWGLVEPDWRREK